MQTGKPQSVGKKPQAESNANYTTRGGPTHWSQIAHQLLTNLNPNPTKEPTVTDEPHHAAARHLTDQEQRVLDADLRHQILARLTPKNTDPDLEAQAARTVDHLRGNQ